MIFETHAHYDDEAFDIDREELLNSLHESQVSHVVNIGSSLKSSKASVELAHKYPFIYASCGVHPSETGELNDENFETLYDLLMDERAVAMGEIGLDYHEDEPSQDIQKKWFVRQLMLAKRVNKPVIIHSRDAAADTFDIISEHYDRSLNGVIHCFSYGYDMALKYVEMGFYIGVGGVVTFKNGKKLKEVVEAVPLSRIVLETDSPYLSPEPYRGKRNSSANLPIVAQKIAELKGVDYDEVVAETEKNARNLYRINSLE